MSFRAAGMSDSSSDEFEYSYKDSARNKLSQKFHDQSNYDDTNNDQKKNDIDEIYQSDANGDREKSEIDALTACMTVNLDVIEEYLNCNGVNEFLHTGWTLLLYACSAVNPKVIEFLLNADANANKHKDGYSPLMAVCDSTRGTTEDNLKCILLLLSANADPNATNKDRRTPLMFACKSKEPEVIEELVKHVKNINATDNEGRTAAFYAVTANQPETLKILIKNRASLEIIDRRNLTLKEIAITKNYEKILQLLDFKDEEIENFSEIFTINSLKDAISTINHSDPETVDPEVANMLYAMNLEKHRKLFKGMNLRTFLQLTNDDLVKLGIDLEYERHMFLNGLRKFHSAKWKPQSIRVAKKSLSYSLYDGVAAIANITRQIAVIGASFGYIRKNLLNDNGTGIILDEKERKLIKNELDETEKILIMMKSDLNKTLKFAEKVQKNSKIMLPPSYIGPQESKKKVTWAMVITISLMTGLLMSRTCFIQRLWN